jgi:predicted transcriptional regulator
MRKTVAELWEDIFKDYDIITEIEKVGFFKITADQIRKYKEPRLMAKFDFSRQLPAVFKTNNLGILPIKNGEYIIGKYNLFKKLPTNIDDIEIKKMSFPKFIETIDPDNIYSESNALNVAQISGMFEDAFGDEFYETIQGKMRTSNFSFLINNNEIDVEGAAIEIDGGYEGKDKVILTEAKNQLPEDFVIRQLYYPYRYWKGKINKEIIPVFFTYENGIYTLFEYKFENIKDYNSIELKKIKRYMLTSEESDSDKKITFDSINTITELPQNVVPFPQADSFTKVIGTVELINSGINTAKGISEEFEFDIRQGSYYISAAIYLDLIRKGKNNGEYELTDKGLNIINLDKLKRNNNLIVYILKHRPFYESYKYFLNNNEMPSKNLIKSFLKQSVPELSDETINRRASTIRGWVQWIIGCQV